MHTILTLNNYGYFPSVMGIIIIVFLSVFFRLNWKYNTIIICGNIILCAIGLQFCGESYDTDIFSVPTPSELICNTITWLTIYLIFCRTDIRKYDWFHFTFLSLLVGAVIFVIIGLDVLIYDVLGVFFTYIMYEYYKKKYEYESLDFLFWNLTIVFLLGCFFPLCNWKFIDKDLRPCYLIHLDWKHLTPEDYYVCNKIEDTEERFLQIYDEINKTSSDMTLIFLEDSTAAYSFKRSTINVSWDGDCVSINSEVGMLKIQKKDSLLVGDIKYRLADVNFAIKINNNNELIVDGSFSELSFSMLCAFQKFLEEEILDLTDYKILLYNIENDFKIGIRYYTNNEYKLYLDKSFL